MPPSRRREAVDALSGGWATVPVTSSVVLDPGTYSFETRCQKAGGAAVVRAEWSTQELTAIPE